MFCEVVGYDVLFIEMVGVGQFEMQVVGMIDFFVLFILYGVGDEFQGIKCGIMEFVDLCVVNKVDINFRVVICVQIELCLVFMLLIFYDVFWCFVVLWVLVVMGEGIFELWVKVQEYVEMVDFVVKCCVQIVVWFDDLLCEVVWWVFLSE